MNVKAKYTKDSIPQ